MHLSLPEWFPVLCLFWLLLQVSSVSNFHPDTRGQGWSLTEAHMFSCAVGRERHCKQISLACVGSARSAWPTLGLTRSRACGFPVCTAQAPGCSAGALSKVDAAFCALARSEQLRQPDPWPAHCPQWAPRLTHLPGPNPSVPGCSVGAPSQVCRVSPLGSWSQAATLRLTHLPGPSPLVPGCAAGALSQVCPVSPLGS